MFNPRIPAVLLCSNLRPVLKCDGHIFILIHRDEIYHADPNPGIKFCDWLSMFTSQSPLQPQP